MENDIITAIATSRLEAAISIIRISGKDAIKFVDKFFSGNLINKEANTINYGYIIDNNKKIDEVMVSIFRAPYSYTGEESVEINCHGGIFITQEVLKVCLKNGARLARRGEFSQRAFLNGRMDLSQAEAVSDLITAKNNYATKLALEGIQGNISNFIADLEEDIIQIVTQIEVNIDYPEYDLIEELTAKSLLPRSLKLKEKMDRILKDSKNIRLVKEGINTVIIGKPNAGKSSLLNALLDEEKAIVTDIAGTTRDLVEGTISLDGLVLNIIDTAGIRKTDNIIEKIGVDKAKDLINQADLVLHVIDGSQELDQEDRELFRLSKNRPSIKIINKMDLETVVTLTDAVKISAKDKNINELINRIKELFDLGKIVSDDSHILTNIRQQQLLEQANDSLTNAIQGMKASLPTDLLVIDLEECWDYLKEILGKKAKGDLLDELFSRFCMGK